jgi:hypothetical protein
MYSMVYVGGVGDVLLAMFGSDMYTRLDDLTELSVEVVIVEINPFVHELFLHHPKREFFKLIYQGLDEFPLDDAWAKSKGFAPIRGHHARDGEVNIYPSPKDLEILATLPPRYACFALSAGHPERNISDRASALAVQLAVKAGFTPVFIGKSYAVTSGLCSHPHVEVSRAGLGGVDLVDKLSLPGSLRCIENAAVTISAFSSTMLMSQFRKKPTLSIYPDKYKYHLFTEINNQRFAAMCNQPGSLVLTEDEATHEAIENFLKGIV